MLGSVETKKGSSYKPARVSNGDISSWLMGPSASAPWWRWRSNLALIMRIYLFYCMCYAAHILWSF